MRKNKSSFRKSKPTYNYTETIINTREQILKIMREVLHTSTERVPAAVGAMRVVADKMVDAMITRNLECESPDEE